MLSKRIDLMSDGVAPARVGPAASRPEARDPSDDWTVKGFATRHVQTPAGRMAVHEAGSGEPLVFLHGIGGGASAWTWIFVAPSFAATHRVSVPDWVGWGSSEHPARFLEFNDYVASLEALLATLGGPATIVAQSLSAGFAMALAERRPDLVRRFVLHTPSGGKDFGQDAFGPLARATITPLARLPGLNRAFYRAIFHRPQFIGGWFRQEGFADPAAVTPEIVDAFVRNARRRNAAYSALPFAAGNLRYDLAPYLQRLRLPTAMFWGAEETQVGLQVARRLGALRPDIPLTLIERAKACPELERPDAVMAAIAEALQAC